ncbi:MAG: hypothetical protein H6R21_2430, partial [Proteobacteria bacterium]|nr:hypothetical protein [Pseudomonadota bacterium]
RKLQALEQGGDVGIGLETLRGAVYVDYYHFLDPCEW